MVLPSWEKSNPEVVLKVVNPGGKEKKINSDNVAQRMRSSTGMISLTLGELLVSLEWQEYLFALLTMMFVICERHSISWSVLRNETERWEHWVSCKESRDPVATYSIASLILHPRNNGGTDPKTEIVLDLTTSHL
jgi:hypothetical protein